MSDLRNPVVETRIGPDDLPFGTDWIAAYFREVDRMDPDGLLAWYRDDASFRFANNEPARGKAAIAGLLCGFYGSILSMHHEVRGIWADATSGALEAEVRFVTTDGCEVALPAVSVLRVVDRRVHTFGFVMDAAPLGGSGT